ncbi:hypothetical protein ABK040_002010 [Willaertia magna]
MLPPNLKHIKFSINEYDIVTDDQSDTVNIPDILQHRNFILMQQTKDETYVNKLINNYYGDCYEHPNLRMLVLNDFGDFLIILGTEQALVILRELQGLFNYPWYGETKEFGWKQKKFKVETVKDIDCNVKYPYPVNYLTVLDKVYITGTRNLN